MKIDINSDLGEGFGIYKAGDDEGIMDNVSSVNVACGFHAGDPQIMDFCSKKAIEKNISIGAHPGYPDLYGFGRRKMSFSLEEIENFVIYQIAGLDGIIKKNGGKMSHVKLHGALYNEAAVNRELSDRIIKGIKKYDSSLILLAMAGSEMIHSAEKNGLKVAREFFSDRSYTAKGLLVPRNMEGSVIDNEDKIIERILLLVNDKKVRTIEGIFISMEAESICVHGDNRKSAKISKAIKEVLVKNGIELKGL